MGQTERIQQLLNFAMEDPHDPFNLYALALEYQIHDRKKAGKYFDKLLKDHKGYLPTYFHAAAFFSQEGERDKVMEIYETGLVLAEKLGQANTRKELQNAYLNFQFEID